ncbi:toll/interleukin-1 receptor domain-containing protein [Catenovulum sp. SX2]|uniref:toll/interleukin-1 receptor domain-containing protein n=1 Tax=Catenovulum sp. SX2 TaxID=3398614 RepID=UPI003F856A42
MAGRNRALTSAGMESYSLNKRSSLIGEDKPCIFLAHISIDKAAVEGIADYIMEKADIDVYLDIHDDALQRAVRKGDSAEITALIERGITSSSHAMCLISEETSKSWWVPYELGYAKKSGKEISSLKLKGAVDLPDFLKIGTLIHGTKSLNEYIERVIRNYKLTKPYSGINESLESHSNSHHPLDSILDWNA